LFFLEQNMARIIRRLLASALLVCVTVIPSGVCANDAGAGLKGQQPTQIAYRRIEVRLRRLHLMRPDLIPYPIAYEIIC
jgi:hypothetical protein